MKGKEKGRNLTSLQFQQSFPSAMLEQYMRRVPDINNLYENLSTILWFRQSAGCQKEVRKT